MIALLQRVLESKVVVDGSTVGEINQGLMVLLGVEKTDTPAQAEKIIDKLLCYRVFEDDQGKMNLGLKDIDGGLLLVPQFTLVADTRKGMRPSFSSGAAPALGKQLFHHALDYAKANHALVESGVFGADMKVHLVNDGPVTFRLVV